MSHWQADEVIHKNESYPEQRHAGAVGLGPEYGKGASTGDQLQGWKEELIGKITHNEQKLKHGHDMRTGEIKRREDQKAQEESPFKQAEEAKKQAPDATPPANVDAGPGKV